MRNPFRQPITYLGETLGRDPGRAFGMYQRDRMFHTYVVGQTGTGKSTLLLNMIRQDVEAGRGFCLIDPHGDQAEAASALMGQHSIYWNVVDPDSGIGYNPLTYVAEESEVE